MKPMTPKGTSRPVHWTKLAREHRFNEQKIASNCHVSVRQLQRYFNEDLGRSPKSWLNEQRMIAARGLLTEGKPIKLVANQLGFKQASHFCREFKRSYLMTPTQFVGVSRRVALSAGKFRSEES